MKLPNGYGSVVKLSGKRRKPYMVRKTTGYRIDPVKEKKIADWIALYEGDTPIECYKYLEKKMKELDKIFRKQTKKVGEEKSLQLAGAKVAGIELRNLQRENNNLEGEIEKIPYTKEQEEMIDNYYRMERALETLDKYLEENYEQQNDEEEEM